MRLSYRNRKKTSPETIQRGDGIFTRASRHPQARESVLGTCRHIGIMRRDALTLLPLSDRSTGYDILNTWRLKSNSRLTCLSIDFGKPSLPSLHPRWLRRLLIAFLAAFHYMAAAGEVEDCKQARLHLLDKDYASAYQLLSRVGTATNLNGCLFDYGVAALFANHAPVAVDALRKLLDKAPSDPEAAYYFLDALQRKCSAVAASDRDACYSRSETQHLVMNALRNADAATGVARRDDGGRFAWLVHSIISAEASLDLYENYTRTHPNDLTTKMHYGVALYKARYPNRALSVFAEVRQGDSAWADNIDYFDHLVATLAVLRRHQDLISFYSDNPARFARWPWALFHVARAYLGIKDVNAAATVLNTQLRLLETDRAAARWPLSRSYTERGDIALLQKDKETAREAYERSIAINDDVNAVVRARRGLNRLVGGR